jgi:hypothetical protein
MGPPNFIVVENLETFTVNSQEDIIISFSDDSVGVTISSGSFLISKKDVEKDLKDREFTAVILHIQNDFGFIFTFGLTPRDQEITDDELYIDIVNKTLFVIDNGMLISRKPVRFSLPHGLWSKSIH